MNAEKFVKFIEEHPVYSKLYFNVNGNCVELDGAKLTKQVVNNVIDAYAVETDAKLKFEEARSGIYVYAEEHQKQFDSKALVFFELEKNPSLSKLEWCEDTQSVYLAGKDVTNKLESYANKLCLLPNLKLCHMLNSDCQQYIVEYAKQTPYYLPKVKELADWAEDLELDSKGNVKSTANNGIIYFSNCSKYSGKFAFNEFTQRKTFDGHNITDADESMFRVDIERDLGIAQPQKVSDAITSVCVANAYHPFKEILESIYWDGTSRIENAFIKYLGVEDTPLNRTFSKKWWYGMVKRIYEPGCPMDSIIIICDPTQGTGKSKFFERLVSAFKTKDPSITYGFDSTITFEQNRDNIAKMNRSVIVLLDECASMLKAAPEQMKSFISNTQETVRLAYDKNPCDYLRHCVFAGTTNETSLLKDYTTDFERRFWLMPAKGQRRSSEWWKANLTDEMILQMWAEAYYLYKTQPNFNYNTLADVEENELREIQLGYKTSNNDDVLKEKILEMLDSTYDKVVFSDYDEFITTIRYHKCDPNECIDTTPEQMVLDAFIEQEGTSTSGKITLHKIDRLPMTWVKRYIQDELKITRNLPSNYIGRLIDWKIGHTKYQGDGKNREIIIRNND